MAQYVNIPTVHLEWNEECYPPMCLVILDDTGECLAAFECEEDAVAWANNHGYDFS